MCSLLLLVKSIAMKDDRHDHFYAACLGDVENKTSQLYKNNMIK